MVLSVPGVVGIIVSKHRIPVLLELVNDNDDSNIDASIRIVSEKLSRKQKVLRWTNTSMKHDYRDN